MMERHLSLPTSASRPPHTLAALELLASYPGTSFTSHLSAPQGFLASPVRNSSVRDAACPRTTSLCRCYQSCNGRPT